jgi:predicted PurR-regulated permease PerM
VGSNQENNELMAMKYRQYLVVLVIVITAAGTNYFYAVSMMLLTSFTLAYLTKGSRCK